LSSEKEKERNLIDYRDGFELVVLKERNIRHTGDHLRRKPVKPVKSYYMRRKERREAAERNQIEGKVGQGKNGHNPNHIRAVLYSK
jgi:hypothetical protein